MYYQQYNGPLNYELDSSNGLMPLERNDYPLISVIINPSTAITTILQPSSTVMTHSNIPTSLCDTALLGNTASVNLITTSSSLCITDSSVTRSSGPTVGNTGNGNAASVIAAVVTIVLVLLVTSIIVILILIVIVYKRRNKATHIPEGRDAFLASSVYSDVTPNGKGENEIHNMCNPNYQAKGAADVYEVPMPLMKGIEAVYSDAMTDVSNPNYEDPNEKSSVPLLYEEPIATLTKKQNDTEFSIELYGLLEEATLYVPTALERSGEQSEEIYSALIHEQHSSANSRLDHTGGNAFFIEDTEYWEPDSNTDGIYQQLSDRKYREIIRHQIKVTDYLGSGQFGTVNKGVWTTPTAGSVSVAIKTFNDNTSEDERVKFLQEAAIMGQFHHPNVVKLHGVVTIGHPIMIVLELISGGDLKEYLNKFKPSPGELVLSSVPSILLSFCRQIASGMEYLSRKKFVHRDLAARNILVSDEGTGICKIADFGMSRDLQDESYYISQAKKIPIKWTAPEALHYKKYSSASDVWSYGAVMYEIWSIGHKPFEMYTNQECIRLVDSGYRLPPPPGCPKPMYKLMMQCWNPDTYNRPSFSDISSSLSSPDKQLLMINKEDPVTVLGGALETSHSLYNDLQYMYKK
ncbi:PREDICTED: high affinity nerve growth factor receptor-like [Amphimedon queenslandica]|uniref:Protein kinase domain-containing protein n=1 Tax=Amphimedon queenslandica TaxID=400682 RepID=A0AAN0JDJ0_AMPQE|nr:PREDICTED: high affinity nerve growth factor receptor-like [Amphimedon queenslandica]|eukprot:XP_019855064.1 PREDICTED: high affinity nerve growth factor receptor-like [Amphimedon queenslandica]